MKTFIDLLPGLIGTFGFIFVLMVALIVEQIIKQRKAKKTNRKYIQR